MSDEESYEYEYDDDEMDEGNNFEYTDDEEQGEFVPIVAVRPQATFLSEPIRYID